MSTADERDRRSRERGSSPVTTAPARHRSRNADSDVKADVTADVAAAAASGVADSLDRFADGFCFQSRSPVLGTPSERGLAFEDVTFPAWDGVGLAGWFIPSPGSRSIVIVNHPMGFTRSGLPSHLEPWRSVWAASGNDIEVDFLPDLEILHRAGHHVLAYDLRNHGDSDTGNGGAASSGIHEARDVLGALAWVRSRRDLEEAEISLFSRCLGASSTFAAMHQMPAAFDDVRSLVAVQPVTAQVILTSRLRAMGLQAHLGDLDRRIQDRTGISLARRRPTEWARSVRVPTYLYGVHDDVLTDPSDLTTMHHNMPAPDKKLQWISDTTRRWDGYLEFQRRPGPVLHWIESHLRHPVRPGTQPHPALDPDRWR